ncbi:MAG: ABC transporter permease [Dehalococcoidia bacterium]|nr:ABC transporter permease [Dehalococcoidia bacterium]
MAAEARYFDPSHGRSRRNSIELLAALTSRDLRLRYQGSVFGWLWTLARPLALGAVLSFALGTVLAAGIADYPVFLLCGLFPWFWFQGGVQTASTSFVGNGGLLKKVVFPRAVLPLSEVLAHTLQFLLAMPVLFVFLLAYGYRPEPAWLIGIPLLFAVQLLLIAGIGLFVASVTVVLRDIEHITEVLLGLLFYATPILYNVDRIPEGYRWIVWVNPLASIAEGWRRVLLAGDLPDERFLVAGGLSLVAFALGWTVFRALEHRFADLV